MKKITVILIYLLEIWSCNNFDSTHEARFVTDGSNVLATYFQNEYFKQWGTKCQDGVSLNNHVLLFEYIELGTSYEYEHFYAIPAKNKTTGDIDCFVLYPFVPTDGDFQGRLEGRIEQPIIIDNAFMKPLSERKMFRYSARFLYWKKKGLSVNEDLYIPAEEICMRMENFGNGLGGTRSGGQYEEYELTVCYELSTYSYVENGELFVTMPSLKDLERLLVMEFKSYGDVLGISLGMPSGTFDIVFNTRHGSIKEVTNMIMMQAEIRLREKYNVGFIYYSVYVRGGNPGPNWKEESLEGGGVGGGGVGSGSVGSGGASAGESDSNLTPIIDIDSLGESSILLDVYNEFYGKSELFQKMLKDFCVENSIAHLRWVVRDTLKSGGYGEFSMLMKNYTFEIRLNELQLINFPKLFICKTMMHEAIHARIFMLLLKVADNPVGNNLTPDDITRLRETLRRNDFPTLFDYYQKFIYHKVAQHNYMADFYIETMVDALQEMNPEVDREICKALAWRGLTQTEAWNSLKQSEQNRYRKIYNDYVNNTHDLFEP